MTKRLNIYIKEDSIPLSIEQSKYVFKLIAKTAGFPYKFTRSIIKADIIYAGRGAKSRLNIIPDKRLADCNRKPRIAEENNIPFLLFYYDKCPIIQHNGNSVTLNNDIIYSIYYLLSGIQEKEIERDRKGYNPKQSILYPNGNFYNPIINIYSSFIRGIFYKSHKPIDIWPNKKKYALALSHDCDYPLMKRYIEAVRYTLDNGINIKKIFEILFSKKQTFWNFGKWMDIEDENGLKSCFYFCANKGLMLTYYIANPEPFYDITQHRFVKLFDKLKERGFEIGLHSSYMAYASLKSFRNERKKLNKYAKSEIVGNRHHYLNVSPKSFTDTVKLHSDIGFLYDSSLGFDKHCGFRRSISTPFYFFDEKQKKELPVLELPLALIDNQLFGYLKFSTVKDRHKIIGLLINNARKYNGLLMVDYHVRILNNDFFPGWGESYLYLLKKVKERNDFYSDTPENIARYWIKRDKYLESMSG